jgi:hypothetical protein
MLMVWLRPFRRPLWCRVNRWPTAPSTGSMCSSAPTVAISVVRARAIGPRPERGISEAPDWACGGSMSCDSSPTTRHRRRCADGRTLTGRGCPTPRCAGLCGHSRMRSAACQRVLARTQCGTAKSAAGVAVSACAGNVSRRGFALALLPVKPELSDASPGSHQSPTYTTYTTCGTGLLASSVLPFARGHRW